MKSRYAYALLVFGFAAAAASSRFIPSGLPENTLPTGKQITPIGDQTSVGSFPANMLLSKSGKFLIVTNTGFRESLSVISTTTGKVVFHKGYAANDKTGAPKGLYFGLATKDNGDGTETLAVSHGAEDQITLQTLSAEGKLIVSGTIKLPPSDNPAKIPYHVAGLAWSREGTKLFAVANQSHIFNDFHGSLLEFDPNGTLLHEFKTGSFPLDVAALPNGGMVVTNEGGREVTWVNRDLQTSTSLATGEQPTYVSLNHRGTKLYVSNSNSDTISEIDVNRKEVIKTILLRPGGLHGFPGTTPLGSALSQDDQTLYVAMADLNAVAVVDTASAKVLGYVPAGWYPTSVALSPDGGHIFVANANGTKNRNPNNVAVKGWGQYIENILEGNVSMIAMNDVTKNLGLLTATVKGDNHEFTPNVGQVKNPGIRHIVYIIKENRTYDQIMGDVPTGNGDPPLTVFGKDVTPNEHALASRFGLFDNFYVCAEVSAEGWNWSTSGQANEYTQRNVPYNYSGRGRDYDQEGTNNGTPVDLTGRRDVAEAAGGYLWDAVLKKGLSVRDYGMFVSEGVDTKGPDGKPIAEDNMPTKRNLVPLTCTDFRQFDLSFPDSEAWIKDGLTPAPQQTLKYGSHHDPSRITTWLREFNANVAANKLPSLTLLRLPRDHTSGTTAGFSSARAMVADNDYAVGQVVDAVSHSPFWQSTAIFIVEDDAQAGFDHVDCHRSPVIIVSPYLEKGAVDSSFYNTDSVIATMESLLGVPAHNQYLATAKRFDLFKPSAHNIDPYQAILPAKAILGEVNDVKAYRAEDSARMVHVHDEETGPDFELNEILWKSIKGKNTPLPNTPGVVWRQAATKKDDD